MVPQRVLTPPTGLRTAARKDVKDRAAQEDALIQQVWQQQLAKRDAEQAVVEAKRQKGLDAAAAQRQQQVQDAQLKRQREHADAVAAQQRRLEEMRRADEAQKEKAQLAGVAAAKNRLVLQAQVKARDPKIAANLALQQDAVVQQAWLHQQAQQDAARALQEAKRVAKHGLGPDQVAAAQAQQAAEQFAKRQRDFATVAVHRERDARIEVHAQRAEEREAEAIRRKALEHQSVLKSQILSDAYFARAARVDEALSERAAALQFQRAHVVQLCRAAAAAYPPGGHGFNKSKFSLAHG